MTRFGLGEDIWPDLDGGVSYDYMNQWMLLCKKEIRVCSTVPR